MGEKAGFEKIFWLGLPSQPLPVYQATPSRGASSQRVSKNHTFKIFETP
jgi:hypothetical protein